MRRLKEIHSEYADSVDMILVGTDGSEDINQLERYREAQGYPWPVAVPDRTLLPNLRIITQSSKLAIGGDGVITYRDGYGRGRDAWASVFEELAASQ